MPALAAIIINDGASSPVAHTFSPVTTNGTRAEYADRSSTTPAGNLKFQHEVLPPSGQRTANKVTIGAYMPVEALVDGTTLVVRSCSAQVVFNFGPQSTKQERDDCRTLVANWLANATVIDSIENIEPFY